MRSKVPGSARAAGRGVTGRVPRGAMPRFPECVMVFAEGRRPGPGMRPRRLASSGPGRIGTSPETTLEADPRRGTLSKPLVFILLSATLASLSCATPTFEERRAARDEFHRIALREGGAPHRVFLISVAGLRSEDYLDAWGHVTDSDSRVRMPNLARLAREGVVGERVRPPSPGSVYASHATLATGRLPTRHGVISDRALDEEGKRTLPFWDNRLLRGTALWDAAIGRGVAAFGWPTTTGARVEWLLPDARPIDSGESWIEFLRNRANPYLVRELESIAEEDFAGARNSAVGRSLGQARDPASWPTPEEKDAAFAELACRLVMSERDPGLWLIRFDQTAAYQRSAGFGTVEVDAALGRIDAAIGRIEDCLGAAGQLGDTALFVVGDVAYQPVHTRVDPNVALVRAGLIGRDPRAATGVRSWLALVRSNGRSAYVYARDADHALEARKVLEEEARRTAAFDVVPAADLAETGADPQAWFGIAARPGYVIGDGLVRPVVRPSTTRASAGTFPFLEPAVSSVGLMAWGRGIRSRVRVPELDMTEIAPTIAALLGLRLDRDLDGKPILGILRAAVPPPPPGPKRLGIGNEGDVERAIRDLRGDRPVGTDR